MNAIGGIKQQVSTRDAERASKLIGDFDDARNGCLKDQATEFFRFKCSECGAPQQFTGNRRGGVETCAKCGRYVDVPELSDEQLMDYPLPQFLWMMQSTIFRVFLCFL